MRLKAVECVNCKQVIGYMAMEALELPTMCPECIFDPEVAKEWGHVVDAKEPQPGRVLRDLRQRLNHNRRIDNQ